MRGSVHSSTDMQVHNARRTNHAFVLRALCTISYHSSKWLFIEQYGEDDHDRDDDDATDDDGKPFVGSVFLWLCLFLVHDAFSVMRMRL